jgi:hypothetical protein
VYPNAATAEMASSSTNASSPRVLVFDLDGCVWDPEMYELYGGAPFKVGSNTLLSMKNN